jgi:acyl carrier protein
VFSWEGLVVQLARLQCVGWPAGYHFDTSERRPAKIDDRVGEDGIDMHPETTMRLDRAQVRDLMALVLATRDVPLPDDESVTLREIGFRSLDFSELALRVEDEIDRELNFDAPGLRSVVTVADVLNLIDHLQAGS